MLSTVVYYCVYTVTALFSGDQHDSHICLNIILQNFMTKQNIIISIASADEKFKIYYVFFKRKSA